MLFQSPVVQSLTPLLCQNQGVIAEDTREVLSSPPSEAATVTCSYISEASLTAVSLPCVFKMHAYMFDTEL